MDELELFLAEALPSLPKEDAEQPTRFFRAAIDYARRWYAFHAVRGSLTPMPTAFVFSNAPRLEETQGSRHLRQFASDLSLSLDSTIVLVSENLREGHAIQKECSSLQDFYQHIDELGWGSRYCVVINPGQHEVTVCFDGVNGAASITFSIVAGVERDWTADELLGELSLFHEQYTSTPLAAAHIWLNAKKRIPLPDCELRIQSLLVLHLMYAVLHTANIIAEHQTEIGRVDVHVRPPSLEIPLQSCVLELKVLRSRFPLTGKTTMSPAENVKHARRGVEQAVAYRERTNAGLAVLCCFDARDGDEELEGFPAYPDSFDVRYQRFYMHSNVAKAQAAVLERIRSRPRRPRSS